MSSTLAVRDEMAMGNTQYAMSEQVLRVKFLGALIGTGWEMPWEYYSRDGIKLTL